MLEQFFVPLNPATDIENCEATVRLKVTGSELWAPPLPDDDLWDETKSWQRYFILFFLNAVYIITAGSGIFRMTTLNLSCFLNFVLDL